MKVKLISYSESKESVNSIGLKSWKKLGMEAEVEETDILGNSVAVLKEYVKGMILDENEIPDLSGSSHNHIPIINKEKERVEIAIDNCTLSSELKLLESDALKHGLVAQYLNKKKEFQH